MSVCCWGTRIAHAYHQGRRQPCPKHAHDQGNHLGRGHIRRARMHVHLAALHQLQSVLKWHLVKLFGRATLDLRRAVQQLGKQLASLLLPNLSPRR
jgi:hypothetical protein